ncbi:GREB1-like protein isoform X1 [Asterias rubens]|uniref:GREB1-like protein isoform X1 n=1 Tax=Asterias rubens TaxID=7604 RepID=UPI0014553F8D|nr:GREB1-like protein isoform X1 [Asterias rubens]XP_033645139.1 GREB1-like protein isoform X1 [Asterias rubens]
MGNTQGLLKNSKFETALHMSIEQSLRSNTATPQPLFSQLYLDKDVKPNVKDLDSQPSGDNPRRESISTSSSTTPLTSPPATQSRPQDSMMSKPLPSPRFAPPPIVSHMPPSIPSPGSMPVILTSPRLPNQPLTPHHLAQQRYVLPSHVPFATQPPPLQQIQHPRSQEGAVMSHSQTSSATTSRQGSPRLSSEEAQPMYRREYLDNVGMLYNTLTGGCQEVGFCQAGADIRLTELSEKQFDVPKGFILVGTKSPYLPENILVAAVDARFLPDPNTSLALLGFSGNCVGCGEKGFRYFTEFSHHINLKLTTQAKKQKHLKYYLVRNKQGQLVRGPNIPWKECRKTSFPGSQGVYMGTPPPNVNMSQTSVIVPRQIMSPTANISYHGNQTSSTFQPRSSPSATINHYGTAPPHDTTAPTHSASKATHHYSTGTPPLMKIGESGSSSSHQQPLKKRHRFHSMDEERLRGDSSPTLPPKRPTIAPPPLHPPNFIPPPLSSGLQDTSFVPPGLADVCRTKVVILDCSGSVPVFHGSIGDIVVSTLFRDSLKPSQPIMAHAAESLGLLGMQGINFETMALVMIQYFVQLGDRLPNKEELDSALLKARQDTIIKDQGGQHNIPQFTTVAPAQLPMLAKLAVATSEGRVKIIIAQGSIAEGVSETLKLLVTMGPNEQRPLYYVIVHVSRQRGTEFCIVVSGCRQARALLEARLSVPETFKEISYEIITGKIQLLTNHFSKNSPAGHDIDALLESFSGSLEGEVFVPFNGELLQRTEETVAAEMEMSTTKEYTPEPFKLHPLQISTAMKILSQVCAIADSDQMALDLGRFIKVDLLFIVPPSSMLFQQTVTRLIESNLLVDLGLTTTNTQKTAEQYIMQCSTSSENQAKFDNFVSKVKIMPHTLFVLVQDQAHLDIYRYSVSQQQHGGIVHRYTNCLDILDAPNVLTLQVSGLPYNLQTKKSRIPPQNEIYMPTMMKQSPSSQSDVDTCYFGIEEYCSTLKWSNEAPLLQFDNVYETIVESLLKRYPKLHSMVVCTYLLIRQYSAALMALAGIPEIREDTTSSTFKIIQDLVTAPLESDSGQGQMNLLRIPCPQLAILAHDKLRTVRDKIGFQYRLDILLCSSEQEITVDEYFLKRLQTWRGKDKSWKPETYEDLDGLPCILILTNKTVTGETLPRSLRAVDLRLVNHNVFDLSSLEQELGLACRYIASDAIDPVVTVTEDSDNEDEEDGESESGMEYELSGTPGLHIDLNSQADNMSTKSDAVSSARSTPKLSVAADTTARLSTSSHGSDKDPSSQPTPHSSNVGSPPSMKPQLPIKQSPRSTTPSRSLESIGMVTSSVPTVTYPPSLQPESDIEGGSSAVKEEREVDGIARCDRVAEERVERPPLVIVSRSVYGILGNKHSKSILSTLSLPPSADTMWATTLRPVPSKDPEVLSAYYRQWSEPKTHHYDYERKGEGNITYHPRRLLLYGPPKVGKTGTFIHFLRVLSRMLIRLQEVEVIDEEDLDVEPPPSDWSVPDVTAVKWPDYEAMVKMPFDHTLRHGRSKNHSPVWTQKVKLGKACTSASESDVQRKPSTVSVRLTKYSAHNAFHHCDQCLNYKDISAVEARETKAYSIRLSSALFGKDLELQFIIPPQQEKHFVFNQRTGQMMSMVLPTMGEQVCVSGPNAVKTPIFMWTFGRHEHGLINLYHSMEGSKHVHVLVCKQKDALAYEKQWPNHIILVLPDVVNEAGPGAAKYFIKELAYNNLQLERSRQEELGVVRHDVWPFVIIMDDSCFAWHECVQGKNDARIDSLVSLKGLIREVEAIPKLFSFAMIGFQQWSGRLKVMTEGQPFSQCHLYNMVFVNLEETQNVQYDHHRFFSEDIDFNLRAHTSSLVLCQLNRFSVMKKFISIGGETVNVTPCSKLPSSGASGHSKDKILFRNYVSTPDSEELVPLIAPPQYLLECFLESKSGERLFPLAVAYPESPVLLVDCYLNLGSQIAVHFVSSRPHSINTTTDSLMFSGLLLYMCDAFVESNFLKQFKFVTGARLCLISPDRSTLRRQVVRLDLEDRWRFRLRDEFQTANRTEDRPLFLLTGTYGD